MKDNQRTHIVLIGFMGTGKSTVSELLAERLSCEAVDIDAVIIEREGMPISDIFATKGEAAFRTAESEALSDVLQREHMGVIATGGGAVLASQNREMMLKFGFVVNLHASAELIIERVSQDTSRPLLQGDVSQRVHKLLEDRKHAYDFAHCTIDTESMTPAQVADAIVLEWRLLF
ncbi:Shikimate kinase [Paenibacillus plantiphilus]|uniref:Shikimate kinase n=1 Tax=Paenibacillus plantiphilus TaxID=2905650 RepID=A0ABM9C8L8_9BACL|nr:shikimate kinase [Paenibacillus plantiphilus]CAH1207001.1 Shikimate kinase [Paenibacillus plantiphilus]